MKKLLFMLLFVLILVGCKYEDGILTLDFNKVGSTFNASNNFNTPGYISIKELVTNSEEYFSKEVNIRGKMVSRLGGYSLTDSGGFYVFLHESSCVARGTGYPKPQNKKYYSIKGHLREGVSDWGNKGFICNEKINK